MLGKLKNIYSKIIKDSLYRNSIYLMISTAIMAALGFIFWIVVSRLYAPKEVGIATTIISVTSIIVSFSLLGLNSGIIRFLPASDRKNDKINSSFNLVAILSIIITAVFLLGLKGFSPKLMFIHDNIIYSFIFILFMIFASLNSLIDSVFIAYRDTKQVLIKNSIFSVAKIIFAALLVSLGAYGIFSSWMIAMGIGVIISLFVLIKKFQYKPKIVFYDSIFHKIGRYSFANYVAGFISGLPLMLLPLFITNLAKVEYTAYYFIALNIANLLFIIPSATANSVFAESSKNIGLLKKQLKKSVKIISYLLLPAILGVIIFGKFILSVFGKGYLESTSLLYIFAISSIFVSINSIYGSLFRIKKMMRQLIAISTFYAIFMVAVSYYFLKGNFIISHIGYAYLISQAFLSVLYFLTYPRKK